MDKFKKSIPRIIILILWLGYLFYKIKEIMNLLYSLLDTLESIKKSIFKIYVSKRIELKQNLKIDLDKFCDEYVKKFIELGGNKNVKED